MLPPYPAGRLAIPSVTLQELGVDRAYSCPRTRKVSNWLAAGPRVADNVLMRRRTAAVFIGLILGFTNACGSVSGSGDGGGGSGSGGAGTGGAAGSTGKGGAGGAAPCQAVLASDRSCTSASDCFAAVHQTNCCGQREFIGIRTSAQSQYQDLEPRCEATYPACGCAEGQPTTDDGSKIQFSATPSVTCLQGVCTTFAAECGTPCASGTTCFSCSNHSQLFAACTTMCAGNTDCHDPTLPMCQLGSSGNTSGMFCTASGVACDTK